MLFIIYFYEISPTANKCIYSPCGGEGGGRGRWGFHFITFFPLLI